MGDLIDRAQAMTELQMSAKRLTLAYEAHGEGRVEYSDIIIRLSDALDTLRGLPFAQPEIILCKDCKQWYMDADAGPACKYTNMCQPADGFCNWAERQEE